MPGQGYPQGAGQESWALLSGFTGVNVADEPTRLQPNELQSAQNWIPYQSNLPTPLTKRPGTAPYPSTLSPFGHPVTALARGYDTTGNRYLIAYVVTGTADVVYQIANDGNTANTITMPSSGSPGGVIVLNGAIYAGNGVDPIQRQVLGSATTVALAAIAASPLQGSAVFVQDANATLPTGTYSYRFAVYDTATGTFTTMTATQTYPHGASVAGAAATPGDIQFTAPPAPAGGLTGTQSWHLFVSLADQAIEEATDQTAMGLAASATITLTTIDVSGLPVPLTAGVTRKGRIFVHHMGRLYTAGDQTSATTRRQVYATNVLVAGLEQQIFNQGDFWPANAFITVDDEVTGLAVAAMTQVPDQPTAPLAIFTNNHTFLFLGDILDDPNASLMKLSSHIGCVSHRTAIPTPVGVIFLGNESVYLLQPTLTEPVDIGWPIEPAIRAIPVSQRPFAVAVYHKGFYKLSITDPDGNSNRFEWWLDLRPRVRGLVTQAPSWWGPHVTGAPLTSACQAEREATEDDRAWGATGSNGTIVLLHQPFAFTDNGVVIQSTLRSARLHGGDPFSRKRVKRVRAIGKSPTAAALPCQVTMDGSTSGTATTLTFPPPTGGQWRTSEWRTAQWTSDKFGEADTPLSPEPFGQSAEIRIAHNLAEDMTIRDIEIRAQVISRPVGP